MRSLIQKREIIYAFILKLSYLINPSNQETEWRKDWNYKRCWSSIWILNRSRWRYSWFAINTIQNDHRRKSQSRNSTLICLLERRIDWHNPKQWKINYGNWVNIYNILIIITSLLYQRVWMWVFSIMLRYNYFIILIREQMV